jgi:hypothetical protein
MNDPLRAAQEVLAGAKERYPAPLAAIASELLYELTAVRPNYMRCFLLEIDLFEVSVAFFSFVQIAQLHRAGAPPAAAEAAVLQVRDNPALCTGHWWGLLRETSRDVLALPAEAIASASRELAGLYFDPSGNTARLGKMLDRVPGLRNRVKGHTWTLSDQQYQTHACELLGTVTGYLSCLEFLERHVLFQCLHCEPDRDCHAVDIALLMGDARRPRRFQTRFAEALTHGRVYLARKDEIAAERSDPRAVLELHPFVQVRWRDGGSEAVYLLQAMHRDAAELRSIVGADTIACARSAGEAKALLDTLLGRSASAASPFGRFRQAVAAVSRQALASAQGRASYRPEGYYVRQRLLRQVDQFTTSAQAVALLAGPSGMGKTALACYLANRWLLSANETEAVLVVFGNELAGTGEMLDEWIVRRLGFSLQELGETAVRAGAQVLIVIDGLERVRDRQRLLDEAATMHAAAGTIPFRFLFTLTESVLPDVLKGANNLAGVAPQLIVIPPLDAGEVRKVYEVCQGAEGNGGVRLPTEILACLGTPLLIRLAQASARAGEDVSAGQVLLAYTEQAVFSDLARAEVVNRLADRMIETGARTIPVGELAQDDWMRSALLSDGADAPLRGLVRDGVLFVEWVPSTGGLPVPAEPHIGFTFDQLRDFVVFARLCRLTGPDLLKLAAGIQGAGPPSPLVGGLRFLVLERLGQLSEGAPHKRLSTSCYAWMIHPARHCYASCSSARPAAGSRRCSGNICGRCSFRSTRRNRRGFWKQPVARSSIWSARA